MSTVERSGETRADRKEPAYLRIAEELREQIASGQLDPNDPLPPERDLCVDHNVSRMTARRALTVLESEGLIYRSATRGTFVSEPRVQLRLGSFSQEISRAGKQPGAQLIWSETQSATTGVARALGIATDADVYALQRLRSSNGEPLALETTYYPSDLVPGFLDGDLSGSLWTEIRGRFGVVVARTTARLEVIALDTTLAEQLGARPASSGLLLTRRTFTADGRCMEYAQDVYRADRVSLVIDRAVDE
ncbi:MAG: GntR family transcriptional regulator [Microbacterium sp.]|uniref:GntR family transcriptional regulator n=1 Tax=Microbacterium sp. TaxID=51671 RepID=UPI003F803FA4